MRPAPHGRFYACFVVLFGDSALHCSTVRLALARSLYWSTFGHLGAGQPARKTNRIWLFSPAACARDPEPETQNPEPGRMQDYEFKPFRTGQAAANDVPGKHDSDDG